MSTLTSADVEKIVDRKLKESQSKLNMFGKSFNTFGDLNANLVLKSKGDVKVLQGGKFITLIKDGKVNCEGNNHLFNVSSLNEVKQDGVYIILGEEPSILIKIKDLSVSVDAGASVSFITELNQDADKKLLALKNIGFIYSTVDDAQAAGVSLGILFSLSDSKLYTVLDGIFSEYKTQAVVSSSESSNSSENDDDLPNEWEFGDYIFSGNIFKLKNSTKELGFLLTREAGQTTLYVDKIQTLNDTELDIEFITDFVGLKYALIQKAYMDTAAKIKVVNYFWADLINPPDFKVGNTVGVNYSLGLPQALVSVVKSSNSSYVLHISVDNITHNITETDPTYTFEVGYTINKTNYVKTLVLDTTSSSCTRKNEGLGAIYFFTATLDWPIESLECTIQYVTTKDKINIENYHTAKNVVFLKIIEINGNSYKLRGDNPIFGEERMRCLTKQYIYLNESGTLNTLPTILGENALSYLKTNEDGTAATWVNAYDDVVAILKQFFASEEGMAYMIAYLKSLGFTYEGTGGDTWGGDSGGNTGGDTWGGDSGGNTGGETTSGTIRGGTEIVSVSFSSFATDWNGKILRSREDGAYDVLAEETFTFTFGVNISSQAVQHTDTLTITYEGKEYTVTCIVNLAVATEFEQSQCLLDTGNGIIPLSIIGGEVDDSKVIFQFSGLPIRTIYVPHKDNYEFSILKQTGTTYVDETSSSWNTSYNDGDLFNKVTPKYTVNDQDFYEIIISKTA